jgi:glycosyltransferase involved in cell wall biosynthesis
MYVRLLVEFSRKEGIETALAMPAAAFASPEFGIHLGDIATDFRHMPTTDAFSAPEIHDRVATVLASRLILVDGDSCLTKALRVRSDRSSGRSAVLLIMRDPRVRQPSSGGAHKLRQLAKRVATGFVQATGRADIVYLRSSVASGGHGPTVPDPITMRSSVAGQRTLKREWDLSPDVSWVAILGAVSARKNVPLVAEAIRLTGNRALGLLVAGRVDDDVVPELAQATEMLRAHGHKVRVVPRLLKDQELDDAVAASDVCVLAHSNEGPSGLMGKAIATGTRVLASGALSLKRDAESYGGVLWVPLSVNDIAYGLTRSLAMPKPNAQTSDSAEQFCHRLVHG